MSRCLISFGANIGDAYHTILAASRQLEVFLGSKAKNYQLSRLFKTPPVGGPVGQPPFVNAAAAFETELSVWEIWDCVRKLEHDFGRERNQRWEARKLDMDILLFGDLRVWTPHLKIPHPRMCMRRFILSPAGDVAAQWRDPVSGLSIADLSQRLQRPAKLLVTASSPEAANSLMIEVARQANATWTSPESLFSEKASRSLALHSKPWNQLMETELEILCGASLPTLLVTLANDSQSSGKKDGACEDRFRQIAAELNLLESDSVARVRFAGPRYMLEAENCDWAIHELVSAFDAMDCPVESVEKA
ncbi:MAG: 2-amino-4-hydroxy-6-hydroxymethyldihydropteridine diphosphokinase [Planctomycetota bacterium]